MVIVDTTIISGASWTPQKVCPAFYLADGLVPIFLATTYFHLPIDEDEGDHDGFPFYPKPITWVTDSEIPSSSHSESSSSSLSKCSTHTKAGLERTTATVNEVLEKNDLYEILTISNESSVDKIALRRAYLLRSEACHPEYVQVAPLSI